MADGFERDITPEMRLEAAGFRMASLEADPATIFLLDRDLRIAYCNRMWDEFAARNGGVGLKRARVTGTRVLEAIAEPLRPFYANGFANAQKLLLPWEHEYECTSPEMFRIFHMRVLPLANGYLLVENSLRVEKPHGLQRPASQPDFATYINGNGFLNMCCHCRRTERVGHGVEQQVRAGGEPVWDWVPEFLTNPPVPVSHGLCKNCRSYFYPDI